jgi:Fe-S-cluster containining protein
LFQLFWSRKRIFSSNGRKTQNILPKLLINSKKKSSLPVGELPNCPAIFVNQIRLMHLLEKSQAVEALFVELEAESKRFHAEAGMGCISGCGFCCANPEVPATALEFLPLAMDLQEKGLAEDIAAQLAADKSKGLCVVYRAQPEDQTKGFCGNYAKRGLICRVFGASARKNNKTNQKELITCKLLKAERPEAFQRVSERINEDLEIPLAPAYYTRLKDIDEALSVLHPINEAILMALELVLRDAYYQGLEKEEGI